MQMSLPRRTFLKGIIATGGAMALGTTVLPPAVMADWPKMAFDATTIEDALMALFESSNVEKSDKITIDAPDIAENGAVVPVEITANMPNVKSITVISEKNPVPLVGQFNFADNAEGWVKTRIKMGGTGDIVAVVKADDKLYVARRKVQVTRGGCDA
jgi:sulfur-oxidizing protein SoxY